MAITASGRKYLERGLKVAPLELNALSYLPQLNYKILAACDSEQEIEVGVFIEKVKDDLAATPDLVSQHIARLLKYGMLQLWTNGSSASVLQNQKVLTPQRDHRIYRCCSARGQDTGFQSHVAELHKLAGRIAFALGYCFFSLSCSLATSPPALVAASPTSSSALMSFIV